MKLILAPMEGVVDYKMRQLLTDIGGYDRCVTEFIRVSAQPVPKKVFLRLCPELEHGGRTRAGVPVYVQLLGGCPDLMAKSAVIGISSGALGIDLNFGCPAKTVNRRDGGSALLQYPRRIESIVDAVRQCVDPAIPVCAKIRLGFDSADLLPEIVERIAAAGANELCIHARTRLDGYKPPAHWQHISGIRRPEKMELIVNGEIWSAPDAREAQHQSDCKSLMLGRGALARPDLARIIRSHLKAGDGRDWQAFSWPEVAVRVERFFNQQDSGNHRYVGNRTKQWLGYLRKNYVGANQLFQQIKKLKDRDEIATMIKRHRSQLEMISNTSFNYTRDQTKPFDEFSSQTSSRLSRTKIGVPTAA